MLDQFVIVVGKSESFWVDEAVRQLFIAYKLKYREAFGPDYWQKALDSMLHPDKLIVRRRVIREQE